MAAVDSRVKAVVAQVPGLSGAIDAQFYPPGFLERSRAAVVNSLKNSNNDQEYIQLFPASAEEAAETPQKAILGGPALFGFNSFIQSFNDGKEFNWDNRVTLESGYYNFVNEFQAYLPRVSPTPLLYVCPSGDFPSGPHEQAYATAKEPKEFFKIEPFNFENYVLGTGERTQRDVEVKFLQKHLL